MREPGEGVRGLDARGRWAGPVNGEELNEAPPGGVEAEMAGAAIVRGTGAR